MTKTIDADMLTHYAGGTTSVAHALFIEREDGEMYGFTEHDANDEIEGFTYVCDDPGLSVNAIATAVGCDVGNMEINVVHSGEVFTMLDLLENKWRNARFLIFRYNFRANPMVVGDECLAGYFGEIEVGNNTLKIELHDLRRLLNEPVGSVRSKTCRYRLGSTSMATGGLCTLDISAPPFTVPFQVTSVVGTGRLAFRDNTLAHAADWFGEGYVEFDSGDLTGVRKKVHAYDADGTFHLSLPTFTAIGVGDTGIAVVGCRHRYIEDCVVKFSNGINFGGEPHSRNVDTLTRPADATS